MRRVGETPTIKAFFEADPMRQIVQFASVPQQGKALEIVRNNSERKVKKIVISSLSDPGEIPNERFDEIWKELDTGISLLFDSGVEAINFTRLHRDGVGFYCRFGDMEALYQQLVLKLREIVGGVCGGIDGNLELNEVARMFTNFEENVSHLQKIFLCFDRAFLHATRKDGWTSLPELMHGLMRREFRAREQVIDTVLTQIVLHVNLFRCGQDDAASPLGIAIRFMDALGFYDDVVEPQLFTQAEDFFVRVKDEFDLTQFLAWYGMVVEREKQLETCGVKGKTVRVIVGVAQKICLEDNEQLLFGDGFMEAIEEGHNSDVRQIYEFCDNEKTRGIFTQKFAAFYSAQMAKIGRAHV